MKRVDDLILEYISRLRTQDPFIIGVDKNINDIYKTIIRVEEDLNNVCKYQNEVSQLQLQVRIEKDKEKSLVRSLVNILDSLEWLLNGNFSVLNEELKQPISSTKKIIKRELENIGVVNTPNLGDLYNENFHICIGYKEDIDYLDNQISEIIKSGYIFEGEVLRLAEVIVVNNQDLEVRNEYNRNWFRNNNIWSCLL